MGIKELWNRFFGKSKRRSDARDYFRTQNNYLFVKLEKAKNSLLELQDYIK